MELMPTSIVRDIPALYATENLPLAEKTVQVKLFTPWSNWTWFICEYDPAQRLAWGLVIGLDTEWGYVSLEELEAIRGPAGLRIERDIHFTPCTVAELVKSEELDITL